jgi:hypothetical protein
MNRQVGTGLFTSSLIVGEDDGYIGLELTRTESDESKPVARIVFWDASGQFALETLGTDVPLEIIEDLIAEAKSKIKVR